MNQNNINIKIKKYLPFVLNILIFISAFLGFLLSCIFAVRDGYSHWSKRLLYFTQQSNIWIGITSLIFFIFLLRKNISKKCIKILTILKYIFTVSITITGFIFCTVLAPFAEFDIWTLATTLTHVVAPILSILDFMTNQYLVEFENKYIHLSIIPPLIYFIFATILCLQKVDFGRGDPFPYFFMDFNSEVGLFGFNGNWPPQFGSVYWFIFFIFFIYLLSIIYYKLLKLLVKKNNKEKQKNLE
ncbi:MAG: hypothetical protein IKC22_03845 [Bacilli bacterium]|nr:hypothetical protein [Bacilli bacterium]